MSTAAMPDDDAMVAELAAMACFLRSLGDYAPSRVGPWRPLDARTALCAAQIQRLLRALDTARGTDDDLRARFWRVRTVFRSIVDGVQTAATPTPTLTPTFTRATGRACADDRGEDGLGDGGASDHSGTLYLSGGSATDGDVDSDETTDDGCSMAPASPRPLQFVAARAVPPRHYVYGRGSGTPPGVLLRGAPRGGSRKRRAAQLDDDGGEGPGSGVQWEPRGAAQACDTAPGPDVAPGLGSGQSPGSAMGGATRRGAGSSSDGRGKRRRRESTGRAGWAHGGVRVDV